MLFGRLPNDRQAIMGRPGPERSAMRQTSRAMVSWGEAGVALTKFRNNGVEIVNHRCRPSGWALLAHRHLGQVGQGSATWRGGDRTPDLGA